MGVGKEFHRSKVGKPTVLIEHPMRQEKNPVRVNPVR